MFSFMLAFSEQVAKYHHISLRGKASHSFLSFMLIFYTAVPCCFNYGIISTEEDLVQILVSEILLLYFRE